MEQNMELLAEFDALAERYAEAKAGFDLHGMCSAADAYLDLLDRHPECAAHAPHIVALWISRIINVSHICPIPEFKALEARAVDIRQRLIGWLH